MDFKYCCIVSLLVIYRAVPGYIVINELNSDEAGSSRYVELKNPTTSGELLGNYVLEFSKDHHNFRPYLSQRLTNVTLEAGELFVIGTKGGDIGYDMAFDGGMHGGSSRVNKAVLYYMDVGVTVKVDELFYVRRLSVYSAYLDTFPRLHLDQNQGDSLSRCDVRGDVIFITAPLTPGTENTCDGFYRTINTSPVVGQHMFQKATVTYPVQHTRALESSRITTCARDCLKETGCDVFHFDYQQSSCRIYVKLL